MVTSTIIGRSPVNTFRTKVEQRNAIKDAMPHEVKQNPWRWDNVSFPKCVDSMPGKQANAEPYPAWIRTMQIAASNAPLPVEYANITGIMSITSTIAVTTHTTLRFLRKSPIAGNANLPTPLNIPHSIIKVITAAVEKPSVPRKDAQEPIKISPMEMLRNMKSQHF